jgi:dephospho-CoA kinase
MHKVGITGGIGSGKSIVSKMFLQLGAAVYDADSAAKRLMVTHEHLISQLKQNFGNDIYVDDKTLNRKKLSDLIFADDKNRLLINSLVHPAVASDFDAWCKKQNAPYVLKEAAILFESGAHVGLSQNICVDAPLELRIARVMHRDNTTREKVLSIIQSQLSDEERKSKCDFVIVNDDETALLPQVLRLHEGFLKKK